MSESTYLSPTELHELIGTPVKSLQIAWLRDGRWRYTVSRAGHPRVTRDYWRRRMVEGDASEAPKARVLRPNFSVIRGAA